MACVLRGSSEAAKAAEIERPRSSADAVPEKHMPHNSNPPLGSKAREGLLYLCMICFFFVISFRPNGGP